MPIQPDNIIRQLIKLRKKRGVSLRKLARLADIAPASVSAIEKGKSSPTLATLNKLLKALSTDFSTLLTSESQSDTAPVFRAGVMNTMRDAYREYTFLFPRRRDFRFEIMNEVIAPTEGQGEWEIHDFDIGCYIIEGGSFELEIDGEGKWMLGKGDAFYIMSRLRHRGTNRSNAPIRLISVIDPPRY